MNWNSASSWQTYNGSSWVTATSYPGQSGTAGGNVTIQSNNSVTISANVPSNVGSLTVNGTLTVNGNVGFANKKSLVVSSGGAISFNSTAVFTGGSGGNALDITLADGSTFTTANANGVATSGSSFSSVTTPQIGSAVNFVFNGAAQSLGSSFPASVNNITFSGSGNKTLTSALSVSGNWTNNGATIVPGTGTVTFNGTAAQSISGSSASAFNNLTISNSSATVSTSADITVGGSLSVTGTFSPGTTNTVGGTGTLTGTGTILVTRIAATADLNSQYTLTNKTLTNLTADYAGAGDQTINIYNYKALKTSGSGTKTLAGAGITTGDVTIASGTTLASGNNNLSVSGNWTNNGTFSEGTATVTFNGAAQNIGASTFKHIVFAGTGPITATGNLSIGGDVTINSGSTFAAGSFTHTLAGNWTNNGTFTAGTSNVTLTGASKTISGATTFSTLTVNGAYTNNITATGLTVSTALSGSGTLTQAANALLLIGGTSDITSLDASASGNTVTYNGSNQSIKVITYNNLIVSGTTPSLSGTAVVNNDMTINSGTTFTNNGNLTVTHSLTGAGNFTQGSGATLNVANDLSVAGLSVNASNNTVNFSGSTGQTIPAASFFNLSIAGRTGTIDMVGKNIGIAGTFSAGAATYSTDGSTITFNGTAQTIPAFSFNNISINGSATLGGDMVVKGDWSNSGTLSANSKKVTFSGNSLQTITGATGFYDVAITNTTLPVSVATASNITVANDLNIGSGSVLAPAAANTVGGSGSISGSGTIQVTKSGTSDDLSGQYIMSGSIGSTVNVEYKAASGAQGIGTRTIGYLKVNNAGGISISGAVHITYNMAFTSGIVSFNGGSLTLDNGAQVSGASNSSFVSGPVTRIGNNAFTFPVGKGANYHPISINPSNVALSSSFTAEYMRAAPPSNTSIDAASGIDHLSTCEYWTLNRNDANTFGVDVTLSWDANSGCSNSSYVTNLASLLVCHFNGSKWNASGNNGTTGNTTAGTITWSGVTSFSPFTLGSMPGFNPLPVTFVNVKATQQSKAVQVSWTNSSEENVAKYLVERSANGQNFTALTEVAPSKNNNASADYQVMDQLPLGEVNYYRIKAIENTGKVTYSSVIRIGGSATANSFVIFPNPATSGSVIVSANLPAGKYNLNLYSSNGQLLSVQPLVHGGGFISQAVSLQGLRSGRYIVEVQGIVKMVQQLIVQ